MCGCREEAPSVSTTRAASSVNDLSASWLNARSANLASESSPSPSSSPSLFFCRLRVHSACKARVNDSCGLTSKHLRIFLEDAFIKTHGNQVCPGEGDHLSGMGRHSVARFAFHELHERADGLSISRQLRRRLFFLDQLLGAFHTRPHCSKYRLLTSWQRPKNARFWPFAPSRGNRVIGPASEPFPSSLLPSSSPSRRSLEL